MDPLLSLLAEELKEHRREWRADMKELREIMSDSFQRGEVRMTKLEVEQGKQRVRGGILATLAGALAGIAARLV